MITKDKFLEFLRESRMTEEMAVPIYVKHYESTLFLLDATEDEKKKIRDLLKILQIESEGHEKAYRKLISEVEKSTQDVY